MSKKTEKIIYTNERGESVEFSYLSIFHTNDVSGLSDIHNTIYSYNAIGQDGNTYLGNRIESRDIEIVGNINATDKNTVIKYRQQLNHILNPQLAAKLIYQYGDFVRVIDCRVNNSPVFNKGTVFMGFVVQLVCLNPYWEDESEIRDDIASWIRNFEFELEISDTGIEFGYREPSLIANVYNGGDVKTGVEIEFMATGTVVNPKIINITNGEFIKFNNLTLIADDILTVSTHYGKKRIAITHNGIKTDAFRYLDIDSTYIQLELGDNLFRYEADENAEGLEVSIYHNNKYLGV